jgi:hypothetical protein
MVHQATEQEHDFIMEPQVTPTQAPMQEAEGGLVENSSFAHL